MNWFLIAFVLAVGASLWLMVCTTITYFQRNRLIDHTITLTRQDLTGDWMRFWRRFGDVSYDLHLWHLITFRDPMKLYRLEDDQEGAGQ